MFVTRTALPWREPERRCQLFAFAVLLTRTDCCDQRRRHERPNTAKLLQSLGYFVAVGERLDLFVEQQDIQATHRIRAELMTQRTAKANQIRGLVAEYGLVAPKHLSSLRAAIPCWLEDAENGLTGDFRALLQGVWRDLLLLDDRVGEMDKLIKRLADSNEDCVRLQQLRGIGPMTSTAMIATVGDARQYQKSRQMAAAIGITPKQHSSGDKHRLLGISKRGDVYLRTLMIHGARAVVARAKHKDDRLSRWVTNIANKKHPNVAAVALANKTARMAWAMLRNKTDYDPDYAIS